MSDTADTPTSGPETGLGATNGTGVGAGADDYADLRAAAEAATTGPWWRPLNDGEEPCTPHMGDYGWYVFCCPAGETEDSPQGRADAAFIATANPARILALLDERQTLSNVLSAVGMEATRLLGDSLEQQKRAERAEAALARVEALVEDCCDCGNESCTEWAWGKAIRAALSGETEREGDAAPSGPADESAREDR